MSSNWIWGILAAALVVDYILVLRGKVSDHEKRLKEQWAAIQELRGKLAGVECDIEDVKMDNGLSEYASAA
jgi:hypothetical protein